MGFTGQEAFELCCILDRKIKFFGARILETEKELDNLRQLRALAEEDSSLLTASGYTEKQLKGRIKKLCFRLYGLRQYYYSNFKILYGLLNSYYTLDSSEEWKSDLEELDDE